MSKFAHDAAADDAAADDARALTIPRRFLRKHHHKPNAAFRNDDKYVG